MGSMVETAWLDLKSQLKKKVMLGVQDATRKSPKLEFRMKTAWGTIVCHQVSQAVPFMNHSAKQYSAVRTCTFFCAFLWCCVHAVWRLYQTAKLLMWRSNEFASNSASNSTRLLRKHTGCLKKHLVIMPYAERSCWLLWRWRPSPTLPTHWNSPPVIVFYSWR
jgi:hypothetical protein